MTIKQKPNLAEARVTHKQYSLCPSCGYFVELEEGQIYCMVCGATLIEKCTGCNEPIKHPTARFCPSCGKLLGVATND